MPRSELTSPSTPVLVAALPRAPRTLTKLSLVQAWVEPPDPSPAPLPRRARGDAEPDAEPTNQCRPTLLGWSGPLFEPGAPRARCSSERAAACALGRRAPRIVVGVSTDEEYVRVRLQIASRTFDLGARAHHYLILLLARQRLRDAASGVPDEASGWIDTQEFAHDPSLAAPRLNLSVHRIRRQIAALDVPAIEIIERRPPGKMRLGVGDVVIERI